MHKLNGWEVKAKDGTMLSSNFCSWRDINKDIDKLFIKIDDEVFTISGYDKYFYVVEGIAFVGMQGVPNRVLFGGIKNNICDIYSIDINTSQLRVIEHRNVNFPFTADILK